MVWEDGGSNSPSYPIECRKGESDADAPFGSMQFYGCYSVKVTATLFEADVLGIINVPAAFLLGTFSYPSLNDMTLRQ